MRPLIFGLMSSSLFLSATSLADAAKCKTDMKLGHEILERVYAAEKFRMSAMEQPYTSNMAELSYNKNEIENNCDFKNWSVSVKLSGTENFLATVKNKNGGKVLTVDQDKTIKEK